MPWRRVAVVGLGACAILALCYLAARETPIFAVRTIEVTGAPKEVRLAAERAAHPFLGESLAALNGGGLVNELEALPSVRSATYDRAFPSTLRIFIVPEQAVAVAKVGPNRWTVSARGRIIQGATEEQAHALPRFRLPSASRTQAGGFLTDAHARTILAALALLPDGFPARIATVELAEAELTMGLRTEWGAPELRLGDSAEMGVKLEVAALVLRSLTSEERAATAYVDVSIPARPVVGTSLDSQVEP